MATVWMVQEDGAVVTAQAQPGEILWDVARRSGLALDAPCGGNGTCGKCRVRLLEGELDSHQSRKISSQDWEQGWRLACGSRILGDVKVAIPRAVWGLQRQMKIEALSQTRLKTVLSSLRMDGIAMGQPFRAVELALEPPTAEDGLPDNERLVGALQQAAGAGEVFLSITVMQKLSRLLRQEGFRVTVRGRMEPGEFRAMDLAPVGDRRLVGAAIDIGTTTVTAVLLDLETGELLAQGSRGNGQLPYGADVISRIIQQGKPNGRTTLRRAVTEDTLTPLLEELCRSVGIWPESILQLVVAANPTMNHLLVGCDACGIRMEPYAPGFLHWEGLQAGDIGLPGNPQARVTLCPNVGAYVGGDITAGVLASGMWNQEPLTLLVDLGTNGEIVLGNREFLLCCACSAGPAFEGGEISCGMRASPGAIEAVRLDPKTMEPSCSVIGGGRAAGLCGSGLIDCVAQLFEAGIIDARGSFVREGSRIRRDENGVARFVLARREESQTQREISLTEVDIASFIRAKGAIYAAIDTMLEAVELPMEAVERLLVAGGIGSGIHLENAVAIGMLPPLAQRQMQYIGNSALLGACAVACSAEAEEQCRELARSMTYLELSSCPDYMERFVAACFLPHTDGKKFPKIKK